MTVIVLAAALIHEGGHWLALRGTGAHVFGLRIGILGAVMETDLQRLSYGRELLCVLAGPGANLLCAVLLRGSEAPVEMIGAHLILGMFNLLPVRPLDGGRALELLVSWVFGPNAGESAARWCGVLTALLLAAALLALMWRSGGSLWLLPASGGMAAAACREAGGRSVF